jgi:hypothetical protein
VRRQKVVGLFWCEKKKTKKDRKRCDFRSTYDRRQTTPDMYRHVRSFVLFFFLFRSFFVFVSHSCSLSCFPSCFHQLQTARVYFGFAFLTMSVNSWVVRSAFRGGLRVFASSYVLPNICSELFKGH